MHARTQVSKVEQVDEQHLAPAAAVAAAARQRHHPRRLVEQVLDELAPGAAGLHACMHVCICIK